MIRLLCTIITLIAASIAMGDNVRVGKLRFRLPDQFHHDPAKGIDSSCGTFRHTGDGFEIHYDIGIVGIGPVGDIAKRYRARWPDRIERDEVLKTALGKGKLIVFDLGTGTKMASFEAAPGVTFYANIGTGAHLEDFNQDRLLGSIRSSIGRQFESRPTGRCPTGYSARRQSSRGNSTPVARSEARTLPNHAA